MRGSRVQNVVSELRGEKIRHHQLTRNRSVCLLRPGSREVTRVYVDNEEQSLEIIVPR